MRAYRFIRFMIPAVFAAVVAVASGGQAQAGGPVSFNDDVGPILQLRCVKCHMPGEEGYENSGLDLTNYDGLMKGTKHGPVVIPGNAYMSNLNVLIEGRAKIRMPHEGRKLTRCEIDIFRRWVNHGALNN